MYSIATDPYSPKRATRSPFGANLNAGIQNTTVTPQPGMLESIAKPVKDSVKGTEAWHGSGLGSTGPLGNLGTVAGSIAKLDDITTVGNNLLAGQFLETSMETAGAFAGGVGGGFGAWVAHTAINVLPSVLSSIPVVRAASTLGGIFLGDQVAGDLTKDFVYGEWVQATTPEIPSKANLEPAHNINGANYYRQLSEKTGTPVSH